MNKTNRIQKLLTNPVIISLFIFIVLFIITINRPMFCDEGIWHYIGKAWIENDMPPYKFTVENKNPAIYELYAISDYLFGVNYMFVRFLGIFSVVLTTVVLFNIGSKLHSRTAGIIAMYIYGLNSSWEIMNGQFPSLTENFTCLFTALSLYFVIKSINNKRFHLHLLLSGIFIGIAISFKQTAIFSFLGLIGFIIIYLPWNKNIIGLIKSGFILLGGMIIACLVFLIPIFLSKVSLMEYIDGAWLILLNNGSSKDLLYRLYH